MKVANRLGIWMDHSTANLMEFTASPIETKTIVSRFTHQVKEVTIHKGEKEMHHKEQHQQSEYYHQIAEQIKPFDEVILFGPTSAKTELLNLLKTDHHFDKIKIEVKSTDKMTEMEQHAFVKDHFANIFMNKK